jgi:rhamnulokinase
MVHRFANGPLQFGDELRWDLDTICAGVEEGLRRCADLAPEGIASIAVDGWAVDYVRLDAQGRPSALPFCYRDQRTVAATDQVHRKLSADRLYSLTGIQSLRINTIYQLYADQMVGSPSNEPWLNLPEYVLYHLGGRRVAEYTNATHAGLVHAQTKTWCAEIFHALDLAPSAAPEIVPPGTDVGILRGPLANLPAFRNTRLIAPACHDTASAIAGIAAEGNAWAYISSGTWSLVGAVLDTPLTGNNAREHNFSNLGAATGGICFHRNINGMWILKQCIETWSECRFDPAELAAAAERLPVPDALLSLDDPGLLMPGNMPALINGQLRQRGFGVIPEAPEAAPVFANLIFHSLAARYAEVLSDLREVTGREFQQIHIVGGGSRNRFLNHLTEKTTGLKVFAGHVESSTIGNFAIQMAVLNRPMGDASNLTARQISEWAALLKNTQNAA